MIENKELAHGEAIAEDKARKVLADIDAPTDAASALELAKQLVEARETIKSQRDSIYRASTTAIDPKDDRLENFWSDFWEQIDEANLTDQMTDIAKELGFPLGKRTFVVTVKVTREYEVEVEAKDSYEAESEVEGWSVWDIENSGTEVDDTFEVDSVREAE